MPVEIDNKKVKEEDLISSEVQEVITFRPNWVIRNGNTILLFLFLSILVSSYFIQYPDLIRGKIRIVSNNTPKQLISLVDGKLEKLLVKNEDVVSKGQPLAYLQSTANHEEVLRLREWVKNTISMFDNESLDKVPVLMEFHFFNLGELQGNFQRFTTVFNEAREINGQRYFTQKSEALQADLNQLNTVQKNIEYQNNLLLQDLELQKVEYNAKEKLMKDKVIAPLEFNYEKRKLNTIEQSLQQMKVQLGNNNISISNKQKEIIDLQRTITERRQEFRSSILTLRSEIEQWYLKYIITATENGKLLFAIPLQENQLVVNNQELFYIQPHADSFHAEMLVSQAGLGKIKRNQRVIIKLSSFPSSEFGYLLGNIEYISDIPNRRDSFLIITSLPRGLKTNYDQTLSFRNSLSGEGEVITRNRTLLDRLVGFLKQTTSH